MAFCLRQPPALPALGSVSPVRADTGSSLAKRQSRAEQIRLPSLALGPLLLVSPAPSWQLGASSGEGTPQNPQAKRDGGSWAPLLHPSLPKLAV